MARVIDAILSLKDKFSPTLKNVSRNLEEQSKIHKRLGKDIESTGKSISSFGKATAVISLPLVAAATAGFALSQSMDKAMARVGMLGNLTVDQTTQMKKGIIDLSNQTGVASETIATAMQKAIAGGIAAGDSMRFLGDAIKYSKVSGMELDTVIETTNSYLKAYSLGADQAAMINDKLVVTARLAKVEMSAMSPALAGVAKAAADAGVSVDQMDAAYAVMVKHGIDNNSAAGTLSGLFESFTKASPKAIKAAESFGIELNRAHIQAIGFPAFLKEIQEKTGGNEQAMGKIIKDVKAFKLALSLTSNDQEFNDMLTQIKDSSGATSESLSKLSTPASRVAKSMNQLKNAGIELADGLQPLIASTAIMITNLVAAFNSLSDEQKNMIFTAAKAIVVTTLLSGTIGKVISVFGSGIGTIASISTGIKTAGSVSGFLATKFSDLIAVFKLVGSAARLLFMNPIGIAIMVVVGLAYLIYTHWGPVKEFFTNLGVSITSIFNSVSTYVQSAMNNISSTITSVTSSIQISWGQVKMFFTSMWSSIVSVFSSAITAIKSWMDQMGITDKLQVLSAKTQAFIAAYIALWLNLRNGIVSIALSIAGPIIAGWNIIKALFASLWTSITSTLAAFIATCITVWLNLRNGIVSIVSAITGPVIAVISSLWNGITSKTTAGGSVIMSVVNLIKNYFITGFSIMVNVVGVVFSGLISIIGTVINGVITVLGGIITFITGVFTGNWQMAWQGVVEIFRGIFSTIEGICNTVMSTIKAAINAVISGVNSVSVDVPDWVPVVGGQHYQSSIPMLAHGTDNWRGGPAMIHDAGPEIVDLPNGSRVIPHSRSMQQEYERGRKESSSGNTISISKLADTIVVREDADIDKIVEKLAFKLKSYAINRAEGAL